jgi:PPP family 3-phenylpropionic acid transporter
LVALNVSVWWLPKQRDVAHQAQTSPPVFGVLKQAKVRWFFASVFFHVFAHIGVYVFLSLYLDALGYSKTMIGILWAVSVGTEIVWFFTQSRWLPLFSLSAWLIVCAGVMVLRMSLTAWWAGTLVVLWIAQMMHAVTFATHHTVCISILTKHFPGRLRGRGQALYASIGYGIPGVLGALLGGLLSDSFGLVSIYQASVAMALVASACAWRTHYLSRRDSFLN